MSSLGYIVVLIILISMVFSVLLFIVKKQIVHLKIKLKNQQESLRRTSKLLIEKNIEVNDQNIRLQKLLEAKSDFVGIASHQLRTPATGIRWGIEGILDGGFGELSEIQHEQIEKIHRSSKRMLRLIDDLLRLVRSESGYRSYIPARVDITELIDEIIDDNKEAFVGKEIKVTTFYGFSGHIIADKEMIAFAISNLVSNAFNYSEYQGEVRIVTKNRRGIFCFEVKDYGIGIPKNKHDLIFRKFKRSKDAIRMNAGGTGLGLYIAKNIVEQHGGSIGFDSASGKGAKFWFTIPIVK